MPRTTHNKSMAATSYATRRADGRWLARIDATWRDHTGRRHTCSLGISEPFTSEQEAEDSGFMEALELCAAPSAAARLLEV